MARLPPAKPTTSTDGQPPDDGMVRGGRPLAASRQVGAPSAGAVADGSAIVGLGAEIIDKAAPPPPDLLTSPPFVFAVKLGTAGAWRVDVGLYRVLPVLRRFPLQPGLNGSRVLDGERLPGGKRGPQRLDVRGELDRLRWRGFTVVPHDVDGPGTSYMQRVATRSGAAHLTRWERAYSGSTRITSDQDGYRAWLASLLDRGVLPEPTVYELEALDLSLADTLDKLRPEDVLLRSAIERERRVLLELIERRSASEAPAPAEPVGI